MAFRPIQAAAATGNLNTVASGSIVAGNTQVMDRVAPHSLSATFTVLAETNTLTIAAIWQVSVDGSTWLRVSPTVNNAAEVVLATGTAGADSAVTRVVPAPSAVQGFKYVRAAVLTGGTTGAAADTYSIQLNFVDKNFR